MLSDLNNTSYLAIKKAALYQYQVPLTHSLNFKGHELSERTGLIVELTFVDGSKGFGEAAALPGFSQETYQQNIRDLRLFLSSIIQTKADIKQQLALLDSLAPSARFAIDSALSAVKLTPKKANQLRKIEQTPLLQGSEEAILEQYQRLNTSTRLKKIKLKVARNPFNKESALIKQLCHINPDLRITLDANQAWTLSQALNFSKSLARHSSFINYIEEPCQTLKESIVFSQHSNIAIALDESLQSDLKLDSLLNRYQKHIKTLVLKPSLIGSFKRCLNIINEAEKHKIPCYLSSSFESDLGIAQLRTLAQIWPNIHALGIDTLKYFTEEIVDYRESKSQLVSLVHTNLICLWQQESSTHTYE